MLSIVDIKKELGNNLFIYPVHQESIKGNSIDFHASRFGWSLKTKRMIADKNKKYLIIPPNDTAMIYTEESIYVSQKIGGTYHSKVTLVCKGLGHIGTTLDPQYLGNSIIAIHNHSNEAFKLRVGAEFVTVIFHYLTSPDYKDARTNDNDPGHPRMLDGYEGKEDYIEWRDQNKWTVQKNLLYNKMIRSEEYITCKEDFKEEQMKFNRKLMMDRTKRYIFTLIISLVILGIFCIPSYLIDMKQVSAIFTAVTERVLFPLFLAILSAQIIVDFKQK